MKKKKSAAKRIIISVIALALISVLIFISICLTLAMRDNIRDKYTLTVKDDGFLYSVLGGAVLGREFDASETEINTYINDKFCSEQKLVRNLMVYFHKDDSVQIYGRLHFLEHDLAFSADGSITFDGAGGVAVLSLSNVMLGELRLHDLVINSILSGFADKTKNVDFRDGKLYIKTSYEYQLGDYSLTLRLEQLRTDEGKAVCKTNSLTLEVLEIVRKFIFSEQGREFFKRIFN